MASFRVCLAGKNSCDEISCFPLQIPRRGLYFYPRMGAQAATALLLARRMIGMGWLKAAADPYGAKHVYTKFAPAGLKSLTISLLK